MMLLNIAEDLKSDCKMTVSPSKNQEEESDTKGEKKPETAEEMISAIEKK
jgi:hypothetical protein